MKNKSSILFISIILLSLSSLGQKGNLVLDFSGIDATTGNSIDLESVTVENLTQGGDTTVFGDEPFLYLSWPSGIDDQQGEDNFRISNCYPNPYKGTTSLELTLPTRQNIFISLQNSTGLTLAMFEKELVAGSHIFEISGTKAGICFLSANNGYYNSSQKLVSSNAVKNSTPVINYLGQHKDDHVLTEKNQITGFVFEPGDNLKMTATASGYEDETIFDDPQENQSYEFEMETGGGGGGEPCPGMPTVTDIDGNQYNTVLIGSQCWMKENLKTTTYRNGTAIPNVTGAYAWNNLTSGAYVWYDNDISWKDSYGALYNWYTTVDANGLCPSGWHVPTDDEWNDLTDYIGGTGSPHGNELKSCRQVNSPLGGGCNTSEHPRWHEHGTHYGTDDYGFSGLPGGGRDYFGDFYGIGTYGYWWSSTEYSSYYAWFRGLGYNYGSVYVYGDDKRSGFSVRCLRDN